MATDEVDVGIAKIAKTAYKLQFALTTAYGGKAVDTSGESWSEEIEEQDTMRFEIPAGHKVYIWQYVLGLGKESKHEVLHCKNLKVTDSANPPDDVPLPHACATMPVT